MNPSPHTRPATERRQVIVEPGNQRGYPVLIGPGLLDEAGSLINIHAPARKAFIIADASVEKLYGTRLRDALNKTRITCATITVPAGEPSKCLREAARICDVILEDGAERNDLVIALGGGVTGDLAGFVAGITLRGLRFVQIPTSLLAQADSSVGGKTGVNTRQGKNLIGLFHQASLVLADTTLPDTLPMREFRSGYAEIVKYGLLGDAEFFDWLDDNLHAMMAGDTQSRTDAVERSCKAKAAIVAIDERETGKRALLNLGHTFGHALESATGYSQRLLHGESVSIGLCLAFALSAELGFCAQDDVGRVEAHLARAGLPTRIGDVPGDPLDVDTLISSMLHDKKVRDGRITFILVRNIGHAFTTQDVPTGLLHSFLDERLKQT